MAASTESQEAAPDEGSGGLSDPHIVEISRTISAPPDQVWQLMTSPTGSAALLGDGAVLGGKGEPWRTSDGPHGVVRRYHPPNSSASRGTPTTTHRPAWSRSTCAPPATAPRSSYGTSGSPTAPRSTCASTGRRPWTAWLRAPPRKSPPGRAGARAAQPWNVSGVLASPTTYSQCHGSSRELGGMAHAGLSQPKAGALARIQSYSTERYFSTPLQKSTARPMPCSLVPGTAARPGLRAARLSCEAIVR